MSAFWGQGHYSVYNDTGLPAYVSMWVDINGDGSWTPEEKVVDAVIMNPVNDISYSFELNDVVNQRDYGNFLFYNLYFGRPDDNYMRLRISTDQDSIEEPYGYAPDGEVEDINLTNENLYITDAWLTVWY